MNPNSPANPEDKVAIVTGAARRIGAAIVGALHNEGMRVAIHYRHSGDEANTLCARLNAARAGSAACFRADLIEEGAPARLLDEVMTWAGSLDLLVNNASSFYPTPLGSIDEAAWNDLVGSNLKAPAPHPKTEKDAGRKKSFCARMSGMPGPMKDEKGQPTRKAASLKRWNCK